MNAFTARDLIIQGAYLAASVLFILGLRSLTRPAQARLGMQQAAMGMVFAVIGTLLNAEILTYQWIVIGLVVGAMIGYPMAMKVPMTAMPQFIAFSHAFGAIAATLVGVVEYRVRSGESGGEAGAAALSHGLAAALGLEVLFGALTVTGSFMAFGKLQELITGRPITFRGQNAVNLTLMGVALTSLVLLVVNPANATAFYLVLGLAFFLGVSMVLPIGGGDMPVVISLLNSYAGLAASATGFAIGNNVLIIAGALEGAGGFILSLLMSKAMNRSFANIIFGAFGAAPPKGPAKAGEVREPKTISPEDAAVQLAYASSVVIIPGYGMAVAQAQHICRELHELIQKKGGEVKYAIHPVAGRMPGHLNVILSEAGIDYGALLTDVDDANRILLTADIAVIIGANDIVNPDAEEDKSSPLYGMPIFRPWTARTVFVIKRGKGTGFSGVENPLFTRDNTLMLYGDAKGVLGNLVKEIKALDEGH
ncbi:MAG TPA: NAD(P)(+) transhydrogenase (Re/Si-specific) subunit beta [Gemmatimonadaceae bacterium]|nr:NAD(P)(+) transhydrogenase (Re/Si-specific) subunit beta [Gemmatimonadaceae bacterium]